MGSVVNNFFDALTTSSGTLSVALYVYVNENGDVQSALAVAAVLMVITLVINLLASVAGSRLKNK